MKIEEKEILKLEKKIFYKKIVRLLLIVACGLVFGYMLGLIKCSG